MTGRDFLISFIITFVAAFLALSLFMSLHPAILPPTVPMQPTVTTPSNSGMNVPATTTPGGSSEPVNSPGNP